MQIIPAIDLYDGKVVRLKKGDYSDKTEYTLSPLKQAEIFKEAGFNHIHIVDLNGAKEGKFINLPIISEIRNKLGLSIQTGGGVRSYTDVERLIESGIRGVICSSMVVKKRSEWEQSLIDYPDKMILGLDLKGGKMAYGGWLETSEDSIESFLSPFIKLGLKTVLSTDISRDGMLNGPNTQLYADLSKRFPKLNFIASGGVSSLKDLQELANHNIWGVVVGKAYYEEHITIDELAIFKQKQQG